MSLAEPIVEGAYYLMEIDGCICGPAHRHPNTGDWVFPSPSGAPYFTSFATINAHRVWITHTDPAEVVAELQNRSSEANRLSAFGYGDAPSYQSGRDEAFDSAADLVAEKLVGET